MLAMMGGGVVILSLYAFFALQLGLAVVGALFVTGIFLIVAQFFEFHRKPASNVVAKGEPSHV